MEEWSVQKSSELYGIEKWGSGYFAINKKGHMSVYPRRGNGPGIDLHQLTNELIARGVRSPMLIRFPDIIQSRIELLSNCFAKAISDCGYQGRYLGVYPIKVNQQRHLVEDIIRLGMDHSLGLECGSKPELLIVLSLMSNSNALIICNGFKDHEYIETAMLSQKLGRNTIVVVERMEELPIILEAAKKFNARPKIGFRSKLGTKSSGKWKDSSGSASKFGLTPSEIVKCVNILKSNELLDCLELFHFHIGSQIPDIQVIKSALKEGARFFSELNLMGAKIKYIDVGGGLGVDYDGSGTTYSSTNYDEQEYANDVVAMVQAICDEKGLSHPHIVTEAGRSLVAHHSVLIFDVVGKNSMAQFGEFPPVSKKDHKILHQIKDIFENVSTSNVNEFYHDLLEVRNDCIQLFTYGVLSLEERAKVEELFWRTAYRIKDIVKDLSENEEIYLSLQQLLSETYFCNFSVFQSAPDFWAIEQIFPVMPIHRLTEQPDCQGKIADITCDSDGVIESFIDMASSEPRKTLPLHNLNGKEPYFIGIFLLGAYQEILGDLHNLFGDTDAVHVTLLPNGYQVDHLVEGDSVEEVLSYVEYRKSEIIDSMRRSCEKSLIEGNISQPEVKLLMKNFEAGLTGYTYLEDLE